MLTTRNLSNNDKGLSTVRRALALLEWVAAQADPPTVKDCAEALGLNLTTSYHLVNTLCDALYLRKDSARHLSLGPRIAALYDVVARSAAPTRALLPTMERLRADTGETCYLSSWEQGEVLMQIVVESRQALRVSGMHVGARGDAYCRASGKAMLAFLLDRELDDFLAQGPFRGVTARTITDPDRLRAELVATAERGYAVDQEEFEDGVCCIAAPYFDLSERLRGAVSVSMPTSRASLMSERIRPHVLRAGEEVSRILGFAGAYPVTRARATAQASKTKSRNTRRRRDR